jgi:hypothetical protein
MNLTYFFKEIRDLPFDTEQSELHVSLKIHDEKEITPICLRWRRDGGDEKKK